MLMPDVNVLVYAYRPEATQHVTALRWLDALANGDVPFALSMAVATGFVRIVTSRSIFDRPSPLPEAFDFVDELMASDVCRPISAGAEHWRIFSRLCTSIRATGKHVADAAHAATAIEHGCTLASVDGDFARFEKGGLRWLPLDW